MGISGRVIRQSIVVESPVMASGACWKASSLLCVNGMPGSACSASCWLVEADLRHGDWTKKGNFLFYKYFYCNSDVTNIIMAPGGEMSKVFEDNLFWFWFQNVQSVGKVVRFGFVVDIKL